MNIHEVLEYGAIVYSDPDVDALITANGSYLNYWVGTASGEYECTECRSSDDDLYALNIVDVTNLAQAWFEELSNEAYADENGHEDEYDLGEDFPSSEYDMGSEDDI